MEKTNSNYIQADTDLFFSKNDPLDTRLGDIFKRLGLENLKNRQPSPALPFSLLGYPDDEGIQLNSGRSGAAQAPTAIRKIFYKQTCPKISKLDSQNIKNPSFYDLGDLNVSFFDLEQRHEIARKTVSQVLNHSRLITLGGGHDYGYADSCGFLDWALTQGSMLAKDSKPVVFNFDAHLDVRPKIKEGPGNSGTPFYRFLSEFHEQAEFLEVGLLSNANSPDHESWARVHGAHLFYEYRVGETPSSNHLPMLSRIKKHFYLQPWAKQRLCYISFDIDVFCQALAPGCSQSWDIGMDLEDIQACLQWIYETFDVRMFSIYEVSPPLDIDHRTSRLAASLLYQYIFTRHGSS